jgi:hypothetical protein
MALLVCFYYLEFDVANARCCRALPPKLRLMNGTSIHLGTTIKYNVKFKYDTAANMYKNKGFDFVGEDDAFLALGAVQKSLNNWSPTPPKAGAMGDKQFFIGVEIEKKTFVIGIGAEKFNGPRWDDCKTDCFLATATGKSNENYTWAIFTKVK